MTLDPDVEATVKAAMRDHGISFKQALNDAARRGIATTPATPFRTPTADMGEPLVPITKALAMAAEPEDEELIRRLAVDK